MPAAAAPRTRTWRAAWLALAVLLPLLAWSPFVLRDDLLDGALLTLAALVALLAGPRPRLLPGTLPFLGCLLLGGLRLLWHPPAGPPGEPLAAPPPDAILGAWAARAPLLAAWLLAGAAAAAPRALARAAPWVLGGGILASLLGLLQAAGLDPLGLRPAATSPPVAPLANTNAAVEFLVPMILAGAARLPSPRRRRLGLLAPALALPALHAGLLGVLAARLSLGVGLTWLAWRRPRCRRRVLLLLLAFLAGEGLRLATAPPPGPELAMDAASPLPRSLRIRWYQWRSSLTMAGDEPLGVGLGRYEVLHPWWRGPEELRLMSADFTDPATPRGDHPHDEPLLFLCECGWAGGLLFLLALWRIWRRRDRARWTDAALLAAGIHALVRAPLAGNPPALALLALLAAWSRARPGLPPPRAWPRGAALLLALLAAVPAPAQLLGEWRTARRFRLVAAGEQPAPEILEAALWVRPWDATGWSLLAADRSAAGAAPAAVREALRECLRRDPANLFALTALLRLEMTAPDRDERLALAALARAERLAPAHPAVREGRSRWLEEQARRFQEEARRQAAGGAGSSAVRPLLLRTWLLRALVAARRGEVAAAREALARAARYAGQRLALERLARDPDLDEGLVRAAVAELLPDLADFLGPPPSGGG